MSKCCKNSLSLDTLCSKCLKGREARIERSIFNDVCTQTAEVGTLSVQNEVANNLCVSKSLQTAQLSASSANINTLCSQKAILASACINDLTIGNFSPCITYRATVNFSTTQTYTLGSPLNFNNIVDDPNNNVNLSPVTSYTAPVSGYYMFSYKVNVENLVATSGPVLGTPIANPELYVNGILVREAYSPWLTFNNQQKVILDSLITLQAGDVVTMDYNVLSMNGASGLAPVVGTVNIIGTGIEDGNSFFKIIFISGLCSGGTSAPCTPCPAVTIPCGTFTNPCSPIRVHCDDFDLPAQQQTVTYSPCDSCQ